NSLAVCIRNTWDPRRLAPQSSGDTAPVDEAFAAAVAEPVTRLQRTAVVPTAHNTSTSLLPSGMIPSGSPSTVSFVTPVSAMLMALLNPLVHPDPVSALVLRRTHRPVPPLTPAIHR